MLWLIGVVSSALATLTYFLLSEQLDYWRKIGKKPDAETVEETTWLVSSTISTAIVAAVTLTLALMRRRRE